jgi:hypothetical protein
MQSRDASIGRRVLLLLGFSACVFAFEQLGSRYEDFLLPQTGVTFVPERELAFYAYYALCGLIGLWCLARLLGSFAEPAFVTRGATWLVRRPSFVLSAVAAWVFAACALFRFAVLDGQAIADDEGTYLFIARTLLQGRLVNPVPEDPALFHNQFVVLDEHGWYGKYPIGHPLVLALAELLHARELIMPLIAALCVPLTYALGRRWFGEHRALLASALLGISPQFIGTAATLLSQTTGCLTLLGSLWLALRARESGRLWPAALAGLTFGFGVLVRPMPGGLFAAVSVVCSMLALRTTEPVQRRAAVARGLLLLFGSALGAAAVLAVNYLQTGDAFSSGYHQAHGSVEVFNNAHADLANSLFGALLRENFWLLGVPACLVPVLFARPQRWAAAFWGMLAAELAYRVIVPKTVVASTGPIYLAEVVPLLVLGLVDGLCQLRERVRWDGAGLQLRALALVAALLGVTASMFWPVQARTLRRGAQTRALLRGALEQAGADRALVFADAFVNTTNVATWAYFADNPWPDLRDDILYVRVPKPDTARRTREIWLRRFSDRRAFLWTWNQRGEPVFEELWR